MSLDNNNPADIGWDDWGSSQEETPQSDDIWGSSDDIWGNQGTFVQQEEVNSQGNFSSEEANFNQGNFIHQDGGINQTYYQGQDDVVQNYQNFDDTGDLTSQVNNNPVKFNFSPKKVSLVLAGILLFLALVLMFIDRIKISPKSNQVQQTQSSQVQQPVQQQQIGTSQGSAVLVEVPDSMNISYSGDVHEANGKVISKKKYVQGHQILYCVLINISFGSSSENVSYYCNYNSFNQVNVGDVVVISYQQVNDSYISISAIQK